MSGNACLLFKISSMSSTPTHKCEEGTEGRLHLCCKKWHDMTRQMTDRSKKKKDTEESNRKPRVNGQLLRIALEEREEAGLGHTDHSNHNFKINAICMLPN